MNSSTQSQIIPQIDELIQQNELLLKENDFLAAFEERFQDDPEVSEHDNPAPLTSSDLLLIALSEASALRVNCDEIQQLSQSSTTRLKALIQAFEQNLATVRRLTFIYQREVLGDTGFEQAQAPRAQKDDAEGSAKTGLKTQEIVHRLPKTVNASAIDSFYAVQTQRLRKNAEQFADKAEQARQELSRLKKQQAKLGGGATQKGLNQVDFDQLKIEHAKLLEKMSIRNQELLRIKLSAGTCLLQMNELKLDLKTILTQKQQIDADIANKTRKIEELKARISSTDKELRADISTLERLKQKEISASDGPYSVDYLSLKVMESTMQKAVEDVQRKINILKRKIQNQMRQLEE